MLIALLYHLSEEHAEALLSVPGSVVVPGTSWLARADLLTDDLLEQVYPALRCADWATVWRLLPTDVHQVYVDARSVRG